MSVPFPIVKHVMLMLEHAPIAQLAITKLQIILSVLLVCHIVKYADMNTKEYVNNALLVTRGVLIIQNAFVIFLIVKPVPVVYALSAN